MQGIFACVSPGRAAPLLGSGPVGRGGGISSPVAAGHGRLRVPGTQKPPRGLPGAVAGRVCGGKWSVLDVSAHNAKKARSADLLQGGSSVEPGAHALYVPHTPKVALCITPASNRPQGRTGYCSRRRSSQRSSRLFMKPLLVLAPDLPVPPEALPNLGREMAM